MKIHFKDRSQHVAFSRPLCGRFWKNNRPVVTEDVSKVDCGLCLRLVHGYTTTSIHPPMKAL